MRTEEFDKAMQTITQERGANYGDVKKHFERCAAGEFIIANCEDPMVRHALNMIWIKVCRLIETPDHQDSIIDIAGYARTIAMGLDERDEVQ